MRPYANRSGDSGVVAYETSPASITLRFGTGGEYLYDYTRPGAAKVEKMKALAAAGRGLSTFVSQHVGDGYARKVR